MLWAAQDRILSNSKPKTDFLLMDPKIILINFLSLAYSFWLVEILELGFRNRWRDVMSNFWITTLLTKIKYLTQTIFCDEISFDRGKLNVSICPKFETGFD